ncbi:hypothetical protein [Arthrobacter pascens]|nr:hypothetical protein [Arthrobacter pascens]
MSGQISLRTKGPELFELVLRQPAQQSSYVSHDGSLPTDDA